MRTVIVRALALGIAAFLVSACGQGAQTPADRVPGSDQRVSGSARESDGLRAESATLSRVSAEIVEVRLELVNPGTQPIEFGTRFSLREEDGASVSGLALLEAAVEKKLYVLRDARDQPICASGLAPLRPGERRTVWARFPAPSSPTVAVQLPGLPPFRQVEVPAAERP